MKCKVEMADTNSEESTGSDGTDNNTILSHNAVQRTNSLVSRQTKAMLASHFYSYTYTIRVDKCFCRSLFLLSDDSFISVVFFLLLFLLLVVVIHLDTP